jgi:transposase-like protein
MWLGGQVPYPGRIDMLNFKGMRFPIGVIVICIRRYVAYPLSHRHLEQMMQERGVSVDHSIINRWAIRFLPHREDGQQTQAPCRRQLAN